MSAEDNNSTKKLAVGFWKKPDGSNWVYADLLKYGAPYPRLIPSFRDLHRIIQAMAVCEDERYPPPAKGRTRLAEFLWDAVHERDYQQLAVKYKIPERDSDVVVNTNGAKLRLAVPINREPDPVSEDEWNKKVDREIEERDALQARRRG